MTPLKHCASGLPTESPEAQSTTVSAAQSTTVSTAGVARSSAGSCMSISVLGSQSSLAGHKRRRAEVNRLGDFHTQSPGASASSVPPRSATASVCSAAPFAQGRSAVAFVDPWASPGSLWASVVGCAGAKAALQEALLLPLLLPRGLLTGIRRAPCTVLLHGPPGTGKTQLVRAAADASGRALICGSAGTLVSKWAGESEQALRALFHEAAAAQPSVLFLDELDALAGPSRSDAAAPGGDASTRRLLAELLLLLGDAATAAPRMLVCAATNRACDLDPALLRRFDKRVPVPLPCAADRLAMLVAWLAGVSVDLGWGGPEEEGEAGEWSSSECAAAAAPAGPGECDAPLPGGADPARRCPHASLDAPAAASAAAALDATFVAPPTLSPPHYCPPDEGEGQPEEAWGHRGDGDCSAAALLAEPCAALQHRGGSVWESWPQQPRPRDAGDPPPSALATRAAAAAEADPDERQPMRLPAHHAPLHRQGLGSQCRSSVSCDSRGRSASARCGGGFLRLPDEADVAVALMGGSGWGSGGGGRAEGLAWLLRETGGWSGADLRALAADAAMAPVWEAVPRLLAAAAAAAAAVAAQGTKAAPATVTGCSPYSGAREAVRLASEGDAEEGDSVSSVRPASYSLCAGVLGVEAEKGEATRASLRPSLLAAQSPLQWSAEEAAAATPRGFTLAAGAAIVPGSESYQSPGDRESLPSRPPDDAALDLRPVLGGAAAGSAGGEAPAAGGGNSEPLDFDPPPLQVRAVSRADFHAALLRVRPALSFGLFASAGAAAGLHSSLSQAGDAHRHDAAAHYRRDTGSESDRRRWPSES